MLLVEKGLQSNPNFYHINVLYFLKPQTLEQIRDLQLTLTGT